VDDNHKYYKYIDLGTEKGRVYDLRYRANANHIELNIRNTFKTYTPEGLDYVRGNIIISPQQFFKDFGIGLKYARKSMSAYFNLLVGRY
jgi:hypothetical protein